MFCEFPPGYLLFTHLQFFVKFCCISQFLTGVSNPSNHLSSKKMSFLHSDLILFVVNVTFAGKISASFSRSIFLHISRQTNKFQNNLEQLESFELSDNARNLRLHCEFLTYSCKEQRLSVCVYVTV